MLENSCMSTVVIMVIKSPLLFQSLTSRNIYRTLQEADMEEGKKQVKNAGTQWTTEDNYFVSGSSSLFIMAKKFTVNFHQRLFVPSLEY